VAPSFQTFHKQPVGGWLVFGLLLQPSRLVPRMAALAPHFMSSEPWRIQMVPGAETSRENGMPAKVMPSDVFMFDEAPQPYSLEAVPMAKPDSNTPVVGGEWVKAVFEVMPYLDRDQLREALVILDRAILNTQRAKALEHISVGAQAGSADSSMPQVGSAAELLRMQVWHEQRSLMAQLQSLRMATQAARSTSTSAGMPAMPSLSSLGHWGGSGAVAASSTLPAQMAAAQAFARGVATAGSHPSAAGMNFGAPVSGRQAPAAQAHAPQAPAASRGTSAHKSGGMVPNAVMAQRSGVQPAAAAPHSSRPEGGTQVQAMTLSMSLQLLSKEDPDTLFIVRRINKLGFKAARKLKVHFSAYGQVLRVLVAHSTVKLGEAQQPGQQMQWRRRPSSLGFIHMAMNDSVRQVLALGSEHEVDGCMIRIQRFERQKGGMGSCEELFAEEGEAEERDGSDDRGSSEDQDSSDFCRPHNAPSGASTATTGSVRSMKGDP